jgi:hypothetical protein
MTIRTMRVEKGRRPRRDSQVKWGRYPNRRAFVVDGVCALLYAGRSCCNQRSSARLRVASSGGLSEAGGSLTLRLDHWSRDDEP